MKVTTLLVTSLATASAFAPAHHGARVETSLSAEKKPLMEKIFGMDLFAPVANQNDYGARNGKNLKVGKIGSNSYVPDGLSAAQYQKIRDSDNARAEKNYQRNVAKAGKFTDFTQWYAKRGTDTTDTWVKSVTRGHDMAKTKYDYSGGKDEQKKYDGSK